MKLNEFDLDLPYVANEKNIELLIKEKGYSSNEAKKYDYEANWRDKRRLFRLETRCISSMFERIFGSMNTDNCSKILVECVDSVSDNRILNLSGVYTIQVGFSYDDFFSNSDNEKKQKTLELLNRGVNVVAKEKDWSLAPFDAVFSKIRELNYINEWVWKKPIKSPDKKRSAEVQVIHDVKSVEIYLVIKDTDGNELCRNLAISELPDEFAYAKHLGELQWLSNDSVVLINKKKDNQWTFDCKK